MFGLESWTPLQGEGPAALVKFIALLLPLLFVLWLLRNRRRYNLQSVPGPLPNSLTVLPRLWSVYKGQSHRDDLALHAKYGAIVRVAPHVVSIADPAALDVLYGVSSPLYKAGFYEPVRFHDEEGLIPDPFVLGDKAAHTRMKRNAANAYALSALVRLEPMVDGVVLRLFKRFDEEYVAKGQVFDIGHYMLYFAMDTIFTVTFGKDTDLIGKGDAKQLCEHLRDGLPYIACVGQIPWVHRFLMGNPYVARFFESNGNALMNEVMAIAVEQRAAAEKLLAEEDDPGAPCTFLMQLLRNQAKNPASITDREINSHTFGNITAGGDTTSTAMRAILYFLIRHPHVTERLRQELREAGLDSGAGAGEEAAEKPAPVVVPYNVASKLPYLSAVIREALRLHPSVGMMLARGVPAGGVTLTSPSLDSSGSKQKKQYFVGAGAEIGVNPWVLHRDPALFPAPEAFDPDRWLRAEPAQLAAMNKAWLPFGAGRHTCSGQHISMLEITKLIPSLVLRYDVAWAPGAPDISVANYFFTMQTGMLVRLRPRKA